ncbi:MAG: hypothetical protein ABIL49_04095 [candidate division WOR-3 bacterium]|jgi:hypothetical protein
MAPPLNEFSAIFILQGGFAGIYEEYLYLKNDKAIIRKDFEFYEVRILDKKIYDYIKEICKKKNFDFEETPLPTDLPTFKIIIQKPCNKEIEMYGVGFGNKKDRIFMNELYNLSRNIKYEILRKTLPSKIEIYYHKIDVFEKNVYVELEDIEFEGENGKIEITDKGKISKVLESLKNYKGRFYFIKNKNNFYQANIEIKF